jgi:hypothetical protein
MGLLPKDDDGCLEGSVIRDPISAFRLYSRARGFATGQSPLGVRHGFAAAKGTALDFPPLDG